ncbi:hypothetical protein LguiA_009967 [Lonicera macranthoides]
MLGPSITNWSCIWNLHVSSKIKIFIRQSLSDCLATMKALSGRKVDVEYVCPICQQEEESDFRALISCSFARCVWIAYGVREALSWLKRKQAGNIILESDSQGFVQAFHSISEDCSLLGLLIDNYRTIAKDIESCKVMFMRRLANVVVHNLARVGFSMFGQ